MKRAPTSMPSAISKKRRAAAVAAASKRVVDADTPYDQNDPAAVAAFWAKGKVRLPGQRGLQKQPTKVPVTVRYSPEVVAYFKATGDGWQTRMNRALLDYVEAHTRT